MFHLLTETSVFIPLPNECLCQVTGEPIIHLKPPPIVKRIHGLQGLPSTVHSKPDNLKRKAPDTQDLERPRKRSKGECRTDSITSAHGTIKPEPVKYVRILSQNDSCSLSIRRTPADVVIPRSRLFYSWPYLVPQRGTILIGLPPKRT